MQSSNLRLLACERGGHAEGHILFLEGLLIPVGFIRSKLVFSLDRKYHYDNGLLRIMRVAKFKATKVRGKARKWPWRVYIPQTNPRQGRRNMFMAEQSITPKRGESI